MPLDPFQLLLGGSAAQATEDFKKRFTFEWLAQGILDRQEYDKDFIVLILGERGAGKSNWGLKLIRAYIRLRRKQDPMFKWSWRNNFPLSRTQAKKMGEKLSKSFIFHDEGGDQFYSQETLKKVQRDLVKFMNKDRWKLNLKIIIWPDPFTLEPKIMNMANLLVMVPYRYKNICSFAFIYGRSGLTITYDKFGIFRARKKAESPTKSSSRLLIPTLDGTMKIRYGNKTEEIHYPSSTFKFLKSMPTFLKMHRFGRVDRRFEDAYKKNVKAKNKDHEEEDRYVPIVVYNRLRDQYQTLLYNLYSKNDMSYAQLERLHISPMDGQHIKSVEGIKRAINSIKAMI